MSGDLNKTQYTFSASMKITTHAIIIINMLYSFSLTTTYKIIFNWYSSYYLDVSVHKVCFNLIKSVKMCFHDMNIYTSSVIIIFV
jgi:hypothetical protein